MKLAILATLAGSAAAFSPSASIGASSRALRMSETGAEETTATTEEPVTAAAAPIVVETPVIPAVVANGINGWSPDAALPMYGLPGAPYSFFDPLGFAKGTSLSAAKRLREAEIMHCRVGMMAFLGYLIGESTPTITYGMDIQHTIANNQLAEVSATILLPLFLAINFAEAFRASRGWVEPGNGSLFTIRETYYPGDLGFDPLGLKPTDATEFAEMQDGELSNGRLAMMAAAGMCAQELVDGQGILEHLGVLGISTQ